MDDDDADCRHRLPPVSEKSGPAYVHTLTLSEQLTQMCVVGALVRRWVLILNKSELKSNVLLMGHKVQNSKV